MTVKAIDKNIKKTRDFLESWKRFHDIFESALSRSAINRKKEEEFLLTKDLISARYEELMDGIGVRPSRRVLESGSIYGVLSLGELSSISDESLSNIKEQWKHSFELLEGILGRLERNKKRMESFGRLSIAMRRKKRRRI